MKPVNPSKSPAPRPAEGEAVDRGNADLQGEGNYEAARRHRRSLKQFIDADKVESAAAAAAPKSPQEERDLKAAENTGLSPGRH